jgi:hypothetical protein
LVSGQITTDNIQFDNNIQQPVIYIVKNGNNIISSSVINFQGSSFSSSVLIFPGDSIKIQYAQYFQETVNIYAGQFSTRITFSQLDYVSAAGGLGSTGFTGATGPTGTVGPTGPSGLVTVYSIAFDGGSSSSIYVSGPAFDCGSSI